MALNSCLYECDVMHYRVTPKEHKFTHKVFMFYVDLDEIDQLSKRFTLFSRNKSNIFSFYDQDHIKFGSNHIKENILEYLKQNGITTKINRIMLLTNVRVFGYIFNPVSFYYCFDEADQPVCVVPEICNTFREIKPFFMGPETYDGKKFVSQQKKHFYISPFVELEVPMDFQLRIPNERLNIRIDDLKDNKKFLYSALTGKKVTMTNKMLLWFGIKYPFITLKVIGLIHIHAAILHYIKKIPYHKKASNPHLQKGVQNEYVAR